MSSGLIFDDIIMNMISNKALEYHEEGVDRFFTNKYNNKNVYVQGFTLIILLEESHS